MENQSEDKIETPTPFIAKLDYRFPKRDRPPGSLSEIGHGVVWLVVMAWVGAFCLIVIGGAFVLYCRKDQAYKIPGVFEVPLVASTFLTARRGWYVMHPRKRAVAGEDEEADEIKHD